MALMEMFNSKPMETKPLNGIIWNLRATVALFYLSPVKFWSMVKHMVYMKYISSKTPRLIGL